MEPLKLNHTMKTYEVYDNQGNLQGTCKANSRANAIKAVVEGVKVYYYPSNSVRGYMPYSTIYERYYWSKLA